jgi:CRP-like cAMP-binding protein
MYYEYVTILGNRLRRPNGRMYLGGSGLEHLPVRSRRALDAAADEAELLPGAVALAQEAPVHWLFVVLDGELALRRDGRDVRVLRAGATYGALEMLSGRHAVGALVARDVTQVLTMPKPRFTALVAEDPAFGRWVLQALARHQDQP